MKRPQDPCRDPASEARDDWADRVRELPARFWVPNESCPECGDDISIRDNGDGRIYDGDEFRCCQCRFTGYLTVDEDGETTINAHDPDPSGDKPKPVETDDKAGDQA